MRVLVCTSPPSFMGSMDMFAWHRTIDATSHEGCDMVQDVDSRTVGVRRPGQHDWCIAI